MLSEQHGSIHTVDSSDCRVICLCVISHSMYNDYYAKSVWYSLKDDYNKMQAYELYKPCIGFNWCNKLRKLVFWIYISMNIYRSPWKSKHSWIPSIYSDIYNSYYTFTVCILIHDF